MVSIEIFDGIPIAVKQKDRVRRFRLRAKKIGGGNRKDSPLSEISYEHKQALENIIKSPTNPRQAVIAAGFSKGHATQTAKNLLSRKPIVEKIDEQVNFRHGVTTDEKVAAVIVDTLEAQHPIKPEQPDHKIRLDGAKEIGKIKDYYPPKKIQQEGKVFHIHLTEEHIRRHEKFKRLREIND